MVKALRAAALIFLLACSAQAGIMQNDLTARSQSSLQNAAIEEQAAQGYIQNDAPASLTETVLSVFQTVLALF